MNVREGCLRWLAIGAVGAALHTGCKLGPSKAEIKACDDAKGAAAADWKTAAIAMRTAMVPDGMQAMNDATVNALSTGSDPKEAKCAKDVQAAEKTAAESLAAAASAADAVGGAAAKASLDVVTLGATAQAAADKAKADRASAHAARKALADALEPAADPSGGKNARLAEVSKKLQDLAAEMQTQIRGETDLSKVFPVADTANAATGLVAAACAKVETK